MTSTLGILNSNFLNLRSGGPWSSQILNWRTCGLILTFWAPTLLSVWVVSRSQCHRHGSAWSSPFVRFQQMLQHVCWNIMQQPVQDIKCKSLCSKIKSWRWNYSNYNKTLNIFRNISRWKLIRNGVLVVSLLQVEKPLHSLHFQRLSGLSLRL